MRIAELGELHSDDSIPEWLVSAPVAVDYFDGAPLPFVLENLEEDRDPGEFRAAIKHFLDLTAADREHCSVYVYKNYRDFIAAVGPEDVEVNIASPRAVWQHVRPTEIRISRRHYRDQSVYVQIVAGCAWEVEHGLQIVYRHGNELCRVSDQDGHLTHADAYDLPEEQDRIA